MKKIAIVIALFTAIFCFAACNKKEERKAYVPNTTIIDVGDGMTEIFEIVTKEDGKAQTDAEGETLLIPYVPPVTDKEGYLVTDAQGSTIPSTTAATNSSSGNTKPNVDTDIGEFDEPENSAKPESTTKPGETTKPGSTAKPESTTKPAATTKPSGSTSTTKPSTTKPAATEPVTSPISGAISSAKAQKLVDIMEAVENPFDEDLAEADFNAAASSIDTYIENIEIAVKAIKSDASLYQFVGNQQLTLWLNNMYEARERYLVFMTMVKQEEGKANKNPLYYQAYTDFQAAYTDSLEAYYFILFAAQDRV